VPNTGFLETEQYGFLEHHRCELFLRKEVPRKWGVYCDPSSGQAISSILFIIFFVGIEPMIAI
jgi:hypothetical protein